MSGEQTTMEYGKTLGDWLAARRGEIADEASGGDETKRDEIAAALAEEFAAAASLSPDEYLAVEGGTLDPSAEQCQALADTLGAYGVQITGEDLVAMLSEDEGSNDEGSDDMPDEEAASRDAAEGGDGEPAPVVEPERPQPVAAAQPGEALSTLRAKLQTVEDRAVNAEFEAAKYRGELERLRDEVKRDEPVRDAGRKAIEQQRSRVRIAAAERAGGHDKITESLAKRIDVAGPAELDDLGTLVGVRLSLANPTCSECGEKLARNYRSSEEPTEERPGDDAGPSVKTSTPKVSAKDPKDLRFLAAYAFCEDNDLDATDKGGDWATAYKRVGRLPLDEVTALAERAERDNLAPRGR